MAELSSAFHVSSAQHFNCTFTSTPAKFDKAVTKAMSETGESKPASGLSINLKVFDIPEDVPEDIKTNKCYVGSRNWTVKEVAASVEQDFGSIDILVHSLAMDQNYGAGMSSAKAALESDTRVLAFEAGRKHKVRVNSISAGPLRSRAAKAIGFVDMMVDYSQENAPLQKELSADEVGNTAKPSWHHHLLLLSPVLSYMPTTV